MGRSVSYPSGALVAFKEISVGEGERCDKCDGEGHDNTPEYDPKPCSACAGEGRIDADYFDFDDLIEDYRGWIKELFPSMEPCDHWLDREDHAIAENHFAYFGVSEYCGLVAIWLVKKDEQSLDQSYYGTWLGLNPLADRWLAQVEKKFLATFGTLRKLGSFSNGEGVYERIEK